MYSSLLYHSHHPVRYTYCINVLLRIVNVRVACQRKKVQGSCVHSVRCVLELFYYTTGIIRTSYVFTHTKRVKSNPLRQTNYVVHKKTFCPTCITNLV